jgi:hypothetical protein
LKAVESETWVLIEPGGSKEVVSRGPRKPVLAQFGYSGSINLDAVDPCAQPKTK